MAVSYDHAQDREEINRNVYQIGGVFFCVFFFSIYRKIQLFSSSVRVVFAITHSRTGVLGLQRSSNPMLATQPEFEWKSSCTAVPHLQ